jgi:hypothetical protein
MEAACVRMSIEQRLSYSSWRHKKLFRFIRYESLSMAVENMRPVLKGEERIKRDMTVMYQ